MFILVEVLEAVKLFLHGVYYDCKIACQDVRGGSKKGVQPAGVSIWTGFQILIKSTLTFLDVNLIHIPSPASSSDFPPLE